MSSLRAIALPTQRLVPVEALETEAYPRPRAATSASPIWAVRVDETIRIIARFGFSPTPSILLISTIAIGAALAHG